MKVRAPDDIRPELFRIYREWFPFPPGMPCFGSWHEADQLAIVIPFIAISERITMSPVVRAIDVGYGNTKYTSLVTNTDKFPQHEIITTNDPVFANVRGFQRAGQQFSDQHVRRS